MPQTLESTYYERLSQRVIGEVDGKRDIQRDKEIKEEVWNGVQEGHARLILYVERVEGV